MERRSHFQAIGLDQRFMAVLVIALALVVFAVTWVSIRESRSDSLQLLVMQGTAFTEALAQAAENAIASEGFIDNLVYLRFSDIVTLVAELDPAQVSDWQLAQLSLDHNLDAVYIFDSSTSLVAAGIARGNRISPPEFVAHEAAQLLANPENRFALLLDENDGPATHYYLEITNDLSHVILVVADALYYVESLRQTQIGYLAQNMTKESGVEYIIYQSTEGIIFASCKPGRLLAIQSDPFLTDALESDSIMHRLYTFRERDVLELVRPFSSEEYPFGVLRIGISLEGYYSISKGFDRLMISLAGVLFVLLLVLLLYLNSRRRRK
ncbi:MAG: hypothetical protein U9R56_02135, partial [candidate division Zixibacteria bacterium]|nr:hypothetical protein [candidate division Zixibacteria bacterium]